MPSTIRVDNEFRSGRARFVGAVDRALPNRRSYVSFVLGFFAAMLLMACVCSLLVKLGFVYIYLNF